jgi:hypothetical protein
MFTSSWAYGEFNTQSIEMYMPIRQPKTAMSEKGFLWLSEIMRTFRM